MLATNLNEVPLNDYQSESFRKAYEWLRTTDLTALERGNYEIDGDTVYAQVHLYETKPAESAKFEAHDVYYDLHYVVSGNELFLVAPREGLDVVDGDESRDIVFLTEPDHYSSVVLMEGDFIIVPPEEAHKPSCTFRTPEQVRKIVIKVKRQ